MESKPALRKHFKTLRDGTSAEDRAAWSARICDHFTQICTSRRIRRIGVFSPLGSEIDLGGLVQRHPDWTFFFPRVSSTRPPRLIWGPEPLEPGVFGLMEPVHAQHFTPPVQLLIVPGLVFDDEGYRIGYGGGFYDALLERLNPDILTLGAAFQLQRAHRLPVSPQDLPVQGIVTEQGLTWFQKPGEE